MSGRIAVFAYGSLVAAASATQTLGRAVGPAPLARLEGWNRDWSLVRDNLASEKTFARPDGSLPAYCLSLNLVPSSRAGAPNGVLVEVSEGELARLDLRELRYDRAVVTGQVRTDNGVSHGFESVIAYTAKPENHRAEPPADAVILAAYPRTIESAFAELGAEQLELFRATTAPYPVEPLEGRLVADAIPAGNPRGW